MGEIIHTRFRTGYPRSVNALSYIYILLWVVALFLSSPTPTAAESSPGFPLDTPGLVKADLAPQLYQDTITNPISDPGITLLSNNSDYQWTDLPDVAAGSGTVYILTWRHNSVGYGYTWPSETRTPQELVNRISYQVVRNPLELAAGATVPSAAVLVRGLAADPTGATVTFSLWTSAGTQVITDAAATIADIDQLSDGTWEATVTHDWTIVQTSGLSGTYYGRFTITLPGGGILVAPPATSGSNALRVVVYP